MPIYNHGGALIFEILRTKSLFFKNLLIIRDQNKYNCIALLIDIPYISFSFLYSQFFISLYGNGVARPEQCCFFLGYNFKNYFWFYWRDGLWWKLEPSSWSITNVEVECDSAALVNLIENGATEFHL